MIVTLDLEPEVEEGLRVQARARGLALDDYLQEIISKQAHLSHAVGTNNSMVPELPILHLGVMGALHRRDIYNDAR